LSSRIPTDAPTISATTSPDVPTAPMDRMILGTRKSLLASACPDCSGCPDQKDDRGGSKKKILSELFEKLRHRRLYQDISNKESREELSFLSRSGHRDASDSLSDPPSGQFWSGQVGLVGTCSYTHGFSCPDQPYDGRDGSGQEPGGVVDPTAGLEGVPARVAKTSPDETLDKLSWSGQHAALGNPLPPSPPPIDELRARLVLAAADPERAGDYLRGEARIVPPAAEPVDDSPEPIPPPVPDDLVSRLAAVLAQSTPWQRMIGSETAMPYFQARAHATLAPLDPLARVLLVTAGETRAAMPSKPASQRQEQSPPDTGRPDRGSITLGAVEARTAFLVVACTQCSRSGRYRVATLIDQHGAGCVIPELRCVLVNDCPKRGNAHGGCDVWFPELPGLFRGDDGGSGGMRPALGIQDTLGSPCD
jgi:hypothetical protein